MCHKEHEARLGWEGVGVKSGGKLARAATAANAYEQGRVFHMSSPARAPEQVATRRRPRLGGDGLIAKIPCSAPHKANIKTLLLGTYMLEFLLVIIGLVVLGSFFFKGKTKPFETPTTQPSDEQTEVAGTNQPTASPQVEVEDDDPCHSISQQHQVIDRAFDYLNTKFCQPAIWFDSFFVDDRIEEDARAGTVIRWYNDFSFYEKESFVVKSENNNSIYLRDVATVTFKDEDKTTYAREFGAPVVIWLLVRQRKMMF